MLEIFRELCEELEFYKILYIFLFVMRSLVNVNICVNSVIYPKEFKEYSGMNPSKNPLGTPKSSFGVVPQDYTEKFYEIS